MFLILFSFIFLEANFLDPYIIDKEDLIINENINEENENSNSKNSKENSDIDASLIDNDYIVSKNKNKKNNTFNSIQTETLFFWPQFFITDLNYALGADLFYAFSFKSEKKKSIPSLLKTSLLFGKNQYFSSSIILDVFWKENKNNLIFDFSSLKELNSYYERGFENTNFISNYDSLDFKLKLFYRRKLLSLYFGISYIFYNKSIENIDNTNISDIRSNKLLLSGISLSLDNINCNNLLYKRGTFLYGLYYYTYNKFLGSDKTLNIFELNLEKTFNVTSINKLILNYDYSTFFNNDVPFLVLFNPYTKGLKPYSRFKYLDKEYMSIGLDLRLLLARRTYLSLNGAGFQVRDKLNAFLLDDFRYSYGLAVLFPMTNYLNARIDYSISKEEKNIYIGLSN